MASANGLENLLRQFDTDTASPGALGGDEFTRLLKSFDENQDGNFSKSEFTEFADEMGLSSQEAGRAYDNLTQDGKNPLSLGAVQNLAKDEMQDGSLDLGDFGDLRSRLLGLGGSQDPSLGNGAGQGNPGLNTSGINLPKAMDGFNSLDTDDSNSVSGQEMKAGLDAAAGADKSLNAAEFVSFATDKLGMSEDDARSAFETMQEETGDDTISTDDALDFFGGGKDQGLGDFLKSISDLR